MDGRHWLRFGEASTGLGLQSASRRDYNVISPRQKPGAFLFEMYNPFARYLDSCGEIFGGREVMRCVAPYARPRPRFLGSDDCARDA